MMTRFNDIDLSALPAPDVIETLDFEALLAAFKARLSAAYPDATAALALESEPLTKLAEAVTYEVMLLRARINDAAHAVMLAHAMGADLDNLVALFGVARLTITPANSTVYPPVAAVMETDGALRARAQLALEGFTSAGTVGAYSFHALSASPLVVDVSVSSPAPGHVRVTILSSEGDGAPAAELLSAVTAAVTADEVRPLCHAVTVAAPVMVAFDIEATIHAGAGPSAEAVRTAALAALEVYLASVRALGATVARSGILAALHQPGALRVDLVSPAADLSLAKDSAPICARVTVDLAVPS